MRKRLIFVLFIWVGLGSALAQHPSTPLIVPPSPNASSLGIYANVPVSKYTGIPSINIPLYSINVNGVTLPISLSYYASGIKVAQEASFVGLGWSLNAGGVITREIRRVDDLSGNGYPNAPTVPEQGENENIDNYVDTLGGTNYSSTKWDTEPDIFSFNFAGYTGKFMFTQNANIVLLKPESALKIEHVTDGFEITTPNGVLFEFKDTEITKAMTYSLKYRDLPNPNWIQTYIVPPGFDYISSWYLSKISLLNGDSITFDYITSASTSQTHVNHFVSSGQSEIKTVTYSENLKELCLNKISWPGGYIDFDTSTREDILPYALSTPLKIDGISIFDSSSRPVKSYVFGNSYFNEEKIDISQKYEYWRLKLDSVTELSNSGQTKPPYVFSYETLNGYQYDLPSKKSPSSDFWGYFNGQENTDEYGDAMFLSEYEEVSDDFSYLYFSGADKKCYPEYLKAGILNQIEYPSGGLRQFDYEANSYESYDAYDYQYTERTIQGKACNYAYCNYWGDPEELQTTDIQEFYIDNNTFSKKRVFISAFSENFTASFPKPSGSFAKLSKITGENGTVIAQIANFAYDDSGSDPHAPCSHCYSSEDVRFYLSSGWYRLTLTPETNLYAEATITIHDRTEGRERQGAGLRVVKIVDDTKERNFDYRFQDGRTSGKLLYKPIRNYWFDLLTTVLISDYDAYYRWLSKIGISIPLKTRAYDDEGNLIRYGELLRYTNNTANFTGGSSESTVGYSEVTEYLNDNAGNISSIQSNFLNESIAPKSPFIPIKPKWSNGLLESEQYLENSKIVKQITATYELDLSTQQNFRALAFNDVYFYFYDIKTEWGKLISKSTSINYDLNSLDPVTSTSRYFYDNSEHFQLTRKETISSKGDTIEATYKYPTDINTGTYALMDSLNMLTYPVEQTTWKNNQVIGSSLTTYRSDNDMCIRDKVYTLKISSPLSSFTSFNGSNEESIYGNNADAEFLEYDSDGNPTKLLSRNGIYTYYVWAYNGQYPVAKIESDNSSVSIDQIQANVDRLSLWGSDDKFLIDSDITALQGAVGTNYGNTYMITLYTYKPLIGMTSQTDPNGKTTYYQYDDFGRLEMAKDDDGNIVKKYNYHYAE